MKFFGKSRYAFLISQFLLGILLSGLAEARANLGKGGPDPFSCNGAEDCNRNALKELANEGFNCLGYEGARVEIFHNVDVYTDGGKNYIDSVYSSKRMEETDHGLPDAKFFNTEHTYPQSFLKEHPRSGLSRADLHHLFPVESKVNGMRGNFPFSECEGKNSDSEGVLCSGGKTFMPPVKQRGVAARAMFYMAVMYSLPINDREERILRKWNELYPPSAFELRRMKKVAGAQGNVNPFVERPEWASLVSDF
jgi:hypothetical protein